ncbi:hypothetical protein SNE40_008676 [Patella caerulea]|uniref:Endonuclease/exonuclease/phosphatase domain-containing protein n=1 Tax=Patella caerulea TaxID=87958 RepID=A0AAN8JQE9_PATCE
MTRLYSKDQLLQYSTYDLLNKNQIQFLKYVTKPIIKRTRRGGTAGRKCRKAIPVRVSQMRNNVHTLRVVNHSNLTEPKIVNGRTTQKFKILLLNARSVNNKASELNDTLIDSECHLFAITETWLGTVHDNVTLASLVPSGYNFKNATRLKRGGGVSLIYKSTISVNVQKRLNLPSFEYLDSIVSTKHCKLRVVLVYRPPSKNQESLFLDEFKALLNSLSVSKLDLLIFGDFNCHVDNLSNPFAFSCKEVLDQYSLQQHVSLPTHQHGHTLDLVITRDGELPVRNLGINNNLISDHFLISFNLYIDKPNLEKKTFEYRKFKTLDIELFKRKLEESSFSNSLDNADVNTKVDIYNSSIKYVIESVLPLQKTSVVLRPGSEWYNPDIDAAKKVRNSNEKTWRLTGLQVHKGIYNSARLNVKSLIESSKRAFYSDKISNSTNQQKDLYKVINTLLDPNYGKTTLPTENCADLPNRIANFFSEKISKIRNKRRHSTQISTKITDLYQI